MKQLKIPNVGDDVLFNLNGNLRPAKVVTGGDGQTTYVGLSVQTASDGGPESLDKCASIFYCYSPHGEDSGKWRWKDELIMKQIVVNVDETTGQVTGSNSVEPVAPAPAVVTEPAPVVTESPSLPVGVGGCLSPESNLGKIVFLQIETIKAAATKIMGMTKNGRLTVTGEPADVEQFQVMVEAIGHSQEELRTVLFGS